MNPDMIRMLNGLVDIICLISSTGLDQEGLMLSGVNDIRATPLHPFGR